MTIKNNNSNSTIGGYKTQIKIKILNIFKEERFKLRKFLLKIRINLIFVLKNYKRDELRKII